MDAMRRPPPTLVGPILISAVALCAACSRPDTTTSATTADAVVPGAPGPAQPGPLPEALQRVDSLAGGDPQEAACIVSAMAAAAPGPDLAARPDAHAGMAGTAVVECLPPAKLAAALAERLSSPRLALGLDPGERDCLRATLVVAAGSPTLTEVVGGLAMEDPAAVHQGGAQLDAACGTHLAAPRGD
jgi:hypothetical protein